MIETESYKQNTRVVRQEGKRLAWILSSRPSNNELLLKSILDGKHIKYKFQKPFYKSINGIKGSAVSYYIAQFWLPRKRLFIEINPCNKHRNPINTDFRVYNALDVFPKAQCIKLTKEDLNTPEFINDFIKLIK